MKIVLVISLVLFLISQGSISIHRLKNSDALAENTAKGQILLSFLTLLPFTMMVVNLNNLIGIKWYWSILIAFLISKILSVTLAEIYSSILGFKSKPQFSLRGGGMVKQNLHLVDFVITFLIGLVLFLIT